MIFQWGTALVIIALLVFLWLAITPGLAIAVIIILALGVLAS